MFQEFINRTGEDVPGMRRGSRFIGPILGFIGGYASIFHFIGVLCGEQPLHYQQTLQHRGAAHVPPLLNEITYIHLAEEARHITFADDYLAQRMRLSSRFRRATYAIAFPFYLRWLIGESMGPPRNFARQFGVPRQVFKTAYWRSAQSRRWHVRFRGAGPTSVRGDPPQSASDGVRGPRPGGLRVGAGSSRAPGKTIYSHPRRSPVR